MNSEQLIIEKLNKIETKIETIEKNMVHVDEILTEDDLKVLNEYHKEKELGKLVGHEDMKRELIK